uniref:Ras-like protein 1 n=1 Tax=Caligus clemensi TaxID=344056 RepID=C1C2M1_CALCM|nr:Ras-like protein 1 precursor [Caligus clemensi]
MGKKSKKGSRDEDGLIYTKVGIFGGGGVGKSCLTLRFQTRRFVEHYDPTILDSFLNKSFMVDGVIRPLEIMDTAGQDEYKSMLDLYLKSSDGFFMVYDVTDRTSFNEISGIVKRLKLSRVSRDLGLFWGRANVLKPQTLSLEFKNTYVDRELRMILSFRPQLSSGTSAI